MTELVLIRHGQASLGSADYDKLSPLGIDQSRLLGEWMLGCGSTPDAVVAGGRVRQHESAVATLQAMGIERPVEVDRAFDEFDHREVLLRYTSELTRRGVAADEIRDPARFRPMFAAAVGRWMSGDHDDYGESWDQFRARVQAGLVRQGERGGSVWVFTSAGPISTSVAWVVGMAPSRVSELTVMVVNSSVTRIVGEGAQLRLGSFNATPHLDRGGAARATFV